MTPADPRLALRTGLNRALMHPLAKPAWVLLALWPLALLIWGAIQGGLGANPAETLIRSTGDWALRLLCLGLSITPLRVSLGLPALARFRRNTGVLCFVYAACHVLAYMGLDMGWQLADIWHDVLKRPFITVGMATFGLLLPLALTSFNRAVRALGGRRWQRLHRLVYLAAALALLHFLWMRSGKQLFGEVWLYGGWLALVLLWRVRAAWHKRRAAVRV
ncbi:sulfoxide reductase heme-binding subunit YedZ [Comamonas serinivorans]|uniref:Protein-methionine-sulfoxide reductase heme-binding subunit MsrQ n=1 Tax=Comamonas serinivorans TaxID=1082851 RepID=A0A1Y0ERH9_9BURK|nr:protein-methionine-sulfoxide reductase heme-binding subunit MsrQ [Comamonas serinivorans]ARU06265.1 sulfoxide reductase heme-binding subunit YedZ [Comamonas serinivorans]